MIATYNVRTLLKDEHVQELEDELKENNMKLDVIELGEVRRKEERFTTLQSSHLLYCTTLRPTMYKQVYVSS